MEHGHGDGPVNGCERKASVDVAAGAVGMAAGPVRMAPAAVGMGRPRRRGARRPDRRHGVRRFAAVDDHVQRRREQARRGRAVLRADDVLGALREAPERLEGGVAARAAEIVGRHRNGPPESVRKRWQQDSPARPGLPASLRVPTAQKILSYAHGKRSRGRYR